MLGYFIRKDGVVYGLPRVHRAGAFDGRLVTFEQSMVGFRTLTDLARINVKPDRVAMRTSPPGGPACARRS